MSPSQWYRLYLQSRLHPRFANGPLALAVPPLPAVDAFAPRFTAKNSASLSSLLLSSCAGLLARFVFVGEAEGTAEARLTGETDTDALALGLGPALTEDLARGFAATVGFGFAFSWLVPSPRSESGCDSPSCLRRLLPDCAGLPADGPSVAARRLAATPTLVLAERDVDAIGALWRISKRGEMGGAERLSA